ncbi:MAG: DUF1993 family protein [Pseudomonadota bacterium]
MTDQDLYTATLPVFRHYLARIAGLVAKLPTPEALQNRLAPDTFTSGEHLETAQGFTLRTVFPLIGRPEPALAPENGTAAALVARGEAATTLLADITKADFEGASARRIRHTAGQAELEQTATEFTTLYAMPNFFFHLTMGYATLRHAGLPLGKADFDGFHHYPGGFRF